MLNSSRANDKAQQNTTKNWEQVSGIKENTIVRKNMSVSMISGALTLPTPVPVTRIGKKETAIKTVYSFFQNTNVTIILPIGKIK